MTDLTREQASPARRASSVKRVGYASLAVVFAAFIVTEVVVSPNREINRSHVWAPLLFMVLPDVSILAAFGSGLKPKQINPRGVLAYNLMHRLWGPMAMIALGFVFPFSPLFLAGLGWGTHVAMDRALGYGLRNRSGFEIPV